MTLEQIKRFIKKNGFLDLETIYCYNTESYFLDDDDEVLGLYYDTECGDVYSLVINRKDETRFIGLSEDVMTKIIENNKAKQKNCQ